MMIMLVASSFSLGLVLRSMNDAMEHGYVEPWALADYFDISENFIIKAIEYYTVYQGKKFG